MILVTVRGQRSIQFPISNLSPNEKEEIGKAIGYIEDFCSAGQNLLTTALIFIGGYFVAPMFIEGPPSSVLGFGRYCLMMSVMWLILYGQSRISRKENGQKLAVLSATSTHVGRLLEHYSSMNPRFRSQMAKHCAANSGTPSPAA